MKEIKTLQELNLLDRFLFAEAIEDKEFMEILLEIIFEENIRLKHLPQAEKEFRGDLSKKKIRVDVWDEGENDIVYDMEVQQENTGNLPKRSRYYQGLMDSKLLPEGTINYNSLKDIYIILIAPFDLFGKGRYIYTFSMMCEEEPEVRLNDGASRLFINTKGKDSENVSEELVSLLRYFESTTDEMAETSGSERIKKLHRKIIAIKASEERGARYMNEYEEKMLYKQAGFEEGIKRGEASGFERGEVSGFERGEASGFKQVAMNLLRAGIAKAVIAKSTGLSMEEIEKLARDANGV